MANTTTATSTRSASNALKEFPVSYVCGFAFTKDQVRLYAEKYLPPESLQKAQRDEGYRDQRELVLFYRRHRIEQTFLPFFVTPHYIWVLLVLPSWDDQVPEITVDKEKMKGMLRRKGPEFATAWVQCAKWPHRVNRPDWLCRKMWVIVREERALLKEQEEATS